MTSFIIAAKLPWYSGVARITLHTDLASAPVARELCNCGQLVHIYLT